MYPFNTQFHTFSGLKKCRFPMFYSAPVIVCVQPPRPDSFVAIDLSQPPMPDSSLVTLPPPLLKHSDVPPTLCQPLTASCGGEGYGLPDHPAPHMPSDIQSRLQLSLTILLFVRCPAWSTIFNQFSGYRIIERMRLLQPSLHGTDQNPLKTTRTRSRQQPIKSFECTMLCFTKTVSSINYYSHSPSNHTLTIPFSVPSSHNRRLWRVPLPPYPWSCVLRRVNSRSIHCKSALQCQQSEPSHQTCAPFE